MAMFGAVGDAAAANEVDAVMTTLAAAAKVFATVLAQSTHAVLARVAIRKEAVAVAAACARSWLLPHKGAAHSTVRLPMELQAVAAAAHNTAAAAHNTASTVSPQRRIGEDGGS